MSSNAKLTSVTVAEGLTTVESLRQHHVEFPRDRQVDAALHQLLDQMSVRRDLSAPIGSDNRDEQDVLLLTGDTGSGKTRAIARAIKKARDPFNPGAPLSSRVVSVKLPSPFSSKELARRVLNGVGFKSMTVESATDSDLWGLVIWQLQEHGTLLLHFDEFQRWKTDRSPGGRQGRMRAIFRLAEILNDLLVGTVWPASLVISGLPEVRDFWNLEALEQVKRRTKFVAFEQMTDSYSKAMGVAIDKYARMGGLTPTFDPAFQIERRLILAARQTVGIALEMVQEAVLSGLARGDGLLVDKDFAKVYADRHAAVAANNPFLASNWQALVNPAFKSLSDLESDKPKAKAA